MASIHTLESLFKRIRKITSDPNKNFHHLVEEVGEISTEMIIENGQSYKSANEGVKGEACDALICCLALLANKTDSLDEILNITNTKLTKWEKFYMERNHLTHLDFTQSEFAYKAG